MPTSQERIPRRRMAPSGNLDRDQGHAGEHRDRADDAGLLKPLEIDVVSRAQHAEDAQVRLVHDHRIDVLERAEAIAGEGRRVERCPVGGENIAPRQGVIAQPIEGAMLQCAQIDGEEGDREGRQG